MSRFCRSLFIVVVLLFCLSQLVFSNEFKEQNEIFQKVKIEPQIGEKLPLHLSLKDENGNTVQLKDFFNKKPVLLTPVYYECPMLCSLILKGLIKTLRILKFVPGNEFEIVSFSFDPKETPEQAKAVKESVINQLGHKEAEQGWHFLTADEKTIAALTTAIGFESAFDPKSGEYAHAATILVITPQGVISKYFYGIEFSPKDVQFGLIQAADEKLGSAIDKLMLLCYHYDPITGKYGLAIMSLIRVGGIITVGILFIFIFQSLRKEKKQMVS